MMTLVKEILGNNLKQFGQFSYYEVIIDKVEKNIISNPDIAIEACKALIEGVSKTILITLDNTLNEHDIKHYELPRLFKDTLLKLSEYDDDFEVDFVSSFKHTVKLIGEIRTHRGDIAHGKPVPKALFSSIELAKFIEHVTSAIVVYMLEHFFGLDITITEKIKYEDSPDFNLILDETIPISGRVQYSIALYEQDYYSYVEQLKEFKVDDEESPTDEEDEEEVSVELEVVRQEVEESVTIQNTSDEIDESYESLFVGETSKDALTVLCKEESLYINEVLKVIETYLFDNRHPLSSNIISTLKNKPKLFDRRATVEKVTKEIMKYTKEHLGSE